MPENEVGNEIILFPILISFSGQIIDVPFSVLTVKTGFAFLFPKQQVFW